MKSPLKSYKCSVITPIPTHSHHRTDPLRKRKKERKKGRKKERRQKEKKKVRKKER